MPRKVTKEGLKVKDLDPRILKCMAKCADRAYRGDEASIRATDQRRFRIIQAFLDGEAKSLRPDAKGNPELATDGHALTAYGEYTVARKVSDKVILINNRRWQYVDAFGNYKQKNITEAMRYWIQEAASIYGYRSYIVTAPLDFPEDAPRTMECYMKFRAEEAFALNKNGTWWQPRWINYAEIEMWGGSYREAARRVLTDASVLDVKVPDTEYSSLQDIDDNIPKALKWLKTRETIRYWLAHGCAFSEEDEAYILRKPSLPVRLGYQAVGGKSMVLPKNPKYMWYWVTQPDRQLEDLSPYISYPAGDIKKYSGIDGDVHVNPIEKYIEHRLQGKVRPMKYYEELDLDD